MRCASATTSSSSLAADSDAPSENGLSASSLIRLPEETTPRTFPRASTMGRWLMPACIISMAASGASLSSRMVRTGIVMIALTGVSGVTPAASTLSRRSPSVTMPSPCDDSTRTARTDSSPISFATALAGASWSTKTGGLRISEETCTALASGAARTLRIGAGESLAQRLGDERHTVLAAQDLHRVGARDGQDRRVLAAAHREGRGLTGEQGGVTEDLTRRDHIDDAIVAEQFHGPGVHDVEGVARRPVLDEHSHAGRHGPFHGGGGHALELGAVQAVERWEA